MNLLIKIFLSTNLLLVGQIYAQTQCIAHRGDNKYYFENSTSALLSAIDKNSHGVEFDILHTQDNIAIVLHDHTLERLAISKENRNCPLETKISNLSYQTIRDNCLLKNGEEIPTLEEFLEILKPLKIKRFLEFKDHPSSKTLSLIKKYNLQRPEKLRIISFEKSALKKIYKLKKKDSFWNKVNLMALYKQTFRPSKKYHVNIHHSALKYIYLLRKKGRELGVWTVDDVSTMKNAIKKGIKFITTNDPETCLEFTQNLEH